eukprot:scaffold2016_cov112-Cylindrotheca_fusiformis.AAC.1
MPKDLLAFPQGNTCQNPIFLLCQNSSRVVDIGQKSPTGEEHNSGKRRTLKSQQEVATTVQLQAGQKPIRHQTENWETTSSLGEREMPTKDHPPMSARQLKRAQHGAVYAHCARVTATLRTDDVRTAYVTSGIHTTYAELRS